MMRLRMIELSISKIKRWQREEGEDRLGTKKEGRKKWVVAADASCFILWRRGYPRFACFVFRIFRCLPRKALGTNHKSDWTTQHLIEQLEQMKERFKDPKKKKKRNRKIRKKYTKDF
jgi:hypothetical protein